MSNVVITISFNTKRDGHKFEVCPERKDIDPAVFGDRVTGALLDSAMAIMSAGGLAKWQIVENLQSFVDAVDSASTAALAKSIRVIEQQ